MANASTKKQNRILLVILIMILATAAILLALFGGANRKSKTTPTLDNKPAESGGRIEESSQKPADRTDPTNDYLTEEIKPNKDEAGETEPKPALPETKKDAEAASADSTGEVFPTLSLPVDNFALKGFSMDVPVFSYTMNDYRTHSGIDIACSPGTPVCSAADGEVCEVVDDPMMGVTVSVMHSGGVVTKYKGLSEESMTMCSVGDTVSRGQLIGTSGDTALIESAEEDHVHFEMTINGKAENPADYIDVKFVSSVTED